MSAQNFGLCYNRRAALAVSLIPVHELAHAVMCRILGIPVTAASRFAHAVAPSATLFMWPASVLFQGHLKRQLIVFNARNKPAIFRFQMHQAILFHRL